MRIEHIIEIEAPGSRVWELTIDVEAWPGITPTVTSVELLDRAPIAVGSRALIKQPGQRARTWTVTILEPERCFAWSTQSMGLRMTGIHLLAPHERGTTNTLRIDLEGPLAWIFGTAFGFLIRRALRAENGGFRTAAERR